MRYVALSINPARIQRMRRIIPDVEVFPGVECSYKDYRLYCIPPAYHNLEQWAVSEGLGLETILMQDDVWLPHGPGFEQMHYEFPSNLIIYGTRESTGIVVPKAYAATPAIHLLLAEVWTGEGRIGPAWMPLVEEYGLVLDLARGLGG